MVCTVGGALDDEDPNRALDDEDAAKADDEVAVTSVAILETFIMVER